MCKKAKRKKRSFCFNCVLVFPKKKKVERERAEPLNPLMEPNTAVLEFRNLNAFFLRLSTTKN